MLFAYLPYHRRFNRPLQTAHGTLAWREGILLQLATETQRSYGEISPLPWFGSETLADALAFCQELAGEVQPEALLTIPDRLPACQFGLGTALAQLVDQAQSPLPRLPLAGLLPSGPSALTEVSRLYDRGYRTFKWKIGVFSLSEELRLLHQLCRELPLDSQLRLDANGSLRVAEAEVWLTQCDQSSRIEYLEQPLSPDCWTDLQSLSQKFRTPIALDESVATLAQLQTLHHLGWRGIYVLKPAICGYPHRLRQFCQTHPLDAVFSSVFETSVGQRAALALAQDCVNPVRAMGFGVQDWLEHDGLDDPDPEQVWQRLCSSS